MFIFYIFIFYQTIFLYLNYYIILSNAIFIIRAMYPLDRRRKNSGQKKKEEGKLELIK